MSRKAKKTGYLIELKGLVGFFTWRAYGIVEILFTLSILYGGAVTISQS